MATRSHAIVEKALEQLRKCPELSALQILDNACRGHEGEDPDFESCDTVTGQRPHPAYADDTEPNSPFGELLRRAFAPHLDPRELMLLNLEDRSDPALAERINYLVEEWQNVIERFAARYRLWSGGL